MVFPQTDFDIEVKLDINGDGIFDTDITSYVLARDGSNGLEISRGSTSEGSLTDPGSCDFQLNNRDGRFSPRNPEGPYYGSLGRNTTIQVAVKGGDTYLHNLTATGTGASTPDSAALSITGDIDIRFDATLDNWFAAGGFGGTAELCGKGEFSAGNRAWILMVRDDLLRFEWSADGTTTIQIDSTAKPLVPLSRRLAVRVTLDVDNGAGGNTVTFYTSDSIGGTWTQLGDPVVTAGTTSIKDEANAVNVGRGWPALGFDSAVGKIHGFELYSGIAGTIKASPDFTAQADGATSFADAQGNTWTRAAFPSANITDLDVRFVGEVVQWPNRWDASGTDIWVDCKAKGIFRRLEAGRTTLLSTLRRRIPTFSPVGYWPMEDSDGSTRFYSPVEGVRPLVQAGMDLASDSTLGGSTALPVIRTGATLSGPAPASASSLEWRVEFVYNFPTLPASNVTLLRIATSSSTARHWAIRMRTGNVLNILATDSDGTSVEDIDIAWTALGGQWNRIALSAVQSGTTINWTVTTLDIAANVNTTYSDTILLASTGRVTGFAGGQPNYGSGADGLIIGHLSLFDDADVTTAYVDADDGFNQERAGVRINRLAAEEDVDVVIHGWTSETEELGPQGPSTFMELLRDSTEGDEGMLVESRDRLAVKFIALSSLTNQVPTVTLTYPDHIQPGLESVPDDRLVENDVTVSRSSGSSGRVQVTEGALSVNAPPNGVNRYETSYDRDIFSDERTDDHAGWLAHLGTWDEERYASVPVWVSARPALFGTLSLVDVGTVLRLTNSDTGNKLPPGDIDLLIKGYDEFLNQRRWEFSFHGFPYGPYRVAELSSTTVGRLDTDGSVLQAAVNSSATTMNVTATDGPFWTRDSAEVPFDLMVSGERITVTSVKGVGEDDFSDNQTDTWASADSGGTWTNAGGVANNFDKAGGLGTHTLTTTNAQRLSTLATSTGITNARVDIQTSALATGASLTGGLVLRFTDSSNYYLARLEFTTGAAVILSIRELAAGVETQLGTFTTAFTHVAGTEYRVRFEASGSTLRARAWLSGAREPSFWQVSVTDATIASGGVGLRSLAATGNTNVNPVVSYDDFVVENPVAMTVTRSVNGVSKSQSASADVRLYQPMYLALN